MYMEPKLPHVLCGLSFCEACHFVRPIRVEKFQNLCTFYVSQKMNLLPQVFYGMVVIDSLSMVGDGGGCGGVALGGHWEGIGRALGGRWEGVGRPFAGGEGWVRESDL